MNFLYNLYLNFFNEKKNIDNKSESKDKNESESIYNYWIF